MTFNFKELKTAVDRIEADLTECEVTLSEVDFFARALELCKTAKHTVTQLGLDLKRCQREFAQAEGLMR